MRILNLKSKCCEACRLGAVLQVLSRLTSRIAYSRRRARAALTLMPVWLTLSRFAICRFDSLSKVMPAMVRHRSLAPANERKATPAILFLHIVKMYKLQFVI
jgi:hypothetical protein